MKKYSPKNYASDQVVGLSAEEARDLRYAINVAAKQEGVDLAIDVDEAMEVLDV